MADQFAGGPTVSETPGNNFEDPLNNFTQNDDAQKTTRDIFGGGDPKENADNANKAINAEQQASKQDVPPDQILGELDKGQQQTEQQKNDETFKDSPDYPILKRLENYVSQEALEKALKEFQDTKDKNEGRRIVLNLVESISDPTIKEKFTKLLNGEEKDINEDNFEGTEFAKDAKISNLELDKGVGGLEIMLAKNYVSIPKEQASENEKENKNKENDLKTTLEVVTNKIIEENSADFKKRNGPLINEIRNTDNLQDKYSKLKKLYKENLKEDAKLGGKKAEKEIHSKKETLKKQAEELQREYEEIQGMSDDSIQKQLKLSEIEAKYRKIIAEGNETTDFEAEIPSLSGGKKDKSPEQTPIPDGMPQTNNIA